RISRRSVIAAASGSHGVELHAPEAGPAQGRYRLAIEHLSWPAANDRTRIAAERDFAEGERLVSECGKDFGRNALAKYEAALERWNAAGDLRESARTLGAIGEVYGLMGKPENALRFHERALARSRESEDRLGESEALNRIGGVSLLLGQRDKAIDHCTRAL